MPWSDWESALKGLEWTNIGTRPDHYPADARAIVKWADPLRAWVAEHPQPLEIRIEPFELQELARNLL